MKKSERTKKPRWSSKKKGGKMVQRERQQIIKETKDMTEDEKLKLLQQYALRKFAIDKKKVEEAVNALWQYVQKSQGLDASALLDNPEAVSLQLGFVKAPMHKGNKTLKIKFDTPLLRENQDVCLFVKDVDPKNRDYSKTVENVKALLEQHKISFVNEIIPVKSLKTEYKPFEAKRNLSDMYDFYLAEESIVSCLPRLLGKHFFKKKRFPVPVNMKAVNLKAELNRALKTSICTLSGRGSSCQVKVAHTGMTQTQAVNNIVAAAESLAARVPGGDLNVKSLHIRTAESPALPVFISRVNPNDVPKPTIPFEEEEEEPEPEEITTLDHKVVVYPDGEIREVFDQPSNEAKMDDQDDKLVGVDASQKARILKNRKRRKAHLEKRAKRQKKVESEEEEEDNDDKEDLLDD